MDVYKIEHPGVAISLRKTSTAEDCQRRPLLPSEKNNAANPAVRKPRTREISSRFKSGVSSAPVSIPSSPRRASSPTISSRSSPVPGASQPKRALSAERRRPTTPSTRASVPSSPKASTPSSSSSRSTTPVRDAVTETQNSARRSLGSRSPDGLWPSMRNLSSSFQPETISGPLRRKEKVVHSSASDDITKIPTNVGSERKRTPLRGRNAPDQTENSRPSEGAKARVIEQHRWPAMLGGRTNALSRSVDLADKVSRSASSLTMSRGLSPKKMVPAVDIANSIVQKSLSDVRTNALSRSVDLADKFSRSASSLTMSRGLSPKKRVPAVDIANSIVQKSLSDVTRRWSVDGNTRMERDERPNRESRDHSSQASERSSSLSRASRTQSLTSPALIRSSSPSRFLSTPSTTFRGLLSPSRTRPSTPLSSSSSSISRAVSTSSVLNYILDVRKGKKNANHIEDAHQLRLLYNANLQWRFANARAEDTFLIQKMRTESILCSVSNDIKQLRDSICMRKIDVQHMQQEMKLNLIMEEQMAYLEHWVVVEREYCASFSGAVDALKASTLRLPVAGGAKADIFAVKNAVSSAVDVMQAMGSSICYLLSKVEDTKMLVAELSAVAAKGKATLDECRDLLASAAKMEVHESSLRTHLIQLLKQDAFKLE